MRARPLIATIACLFLFASCGGSDSSSTASTVVSQTGTGKVNPTYAEFCEASSNLNGAMSGPHGENPSAITDPIEMKAAWANITELSIELQALTPKSLKKDADTMIESIVSMNEIFKENNYELLVIAKSQPFAMHCQRLLPTLQLQKHQHDLMRSSRRTAACS